MEGADRKVGSLGSEDSDVELYSSVSVAVLGADGELLHSKQPSASPYSMHLHCRKVTANVLTQCFNLCLLSSLLLGILYLFFGAFPLVFGNNHGFTLSQVGLTFLGIFVGMMLGISCDPLWRRCYQHLVVRNQGKSEPEFRLPSTVAGALIVPVGLFGRCS